MANFVVNELHGARRATIDQDDIRHYTRRWRVETDTNLDDAADIRELADIPQIGEKYVVENGADAGAKVVSVEANQDDNPYVWFVDVEYSSDTDTGRTRVDYSFEPYTEPLEYDIDGDKIVASSTEPFDPPQEVERGRLVITLTRTETNFNAQTALSYLFKLNKSTWFGFDARTCLMADIRATDQGSSPIQHEVQYVVKVASVFLKAKGGRLGDFFGPLNLAGASGWDRRLLDRGYYELISGNLVQITDSGQPLSAPALLDGAGRKLASTANPVFRVFQVYDEIDFNNLNLP